eukprot:TRINITY_DN5924_c0_g1_i1.p1 TRINITY_DN5924_c0_g1~~TRINITY_DN5924_c0_g1_i1.p1  ORF type:complete len:240 (+),score=43.25 TRINITY_DN5924_c0_g1_i1:69-722(+)
MAMSGYTSTLRFPSDLNPNLRKMTMNLVPFPRLHFPIIGIAPFSTTPLLEDTVDNGWSMDLLLKTGESDGLLAACNPRYGRTLSSVSVYRGQFAKKIVTDYMTSTSNYKTPYFVEWIPDNVKYCFCDVPPKDTLLSCTWIGNTTAVNDVFKRIERPFDAMFRRKAFMRSCCGYGMDEMEFTEAQANTKDLIDEYQTYQEVRIDDEDWYDDGEDYDEE